MKKYISFIISIVLLLNGCVVRKENRSYGTTTIVYGVESFPKDLILMEDIKNKYNYLLVNLFEGLVKKDDEGNIIPGLAYKWDISEDGSKYTFKIRHDAKWSDGNKITSRDFVYFFSEILKQDVKNRFNYHLDYVNGIEEYRKGNLSFDETGIKEIDKNTLEINLKYPCLYLLDILSSPLYALRKVNYTLVSWKEDFQYILYSGAYKINDFNNDMLELGVNKNYWDGENTKNYKIIIQNEESEEGVLAAFETSRIDFFKIYSTSTNYITKEDTYILQKNSSLSKALAFNCESEKVKDVELRKNIYKSIDREYLGKSVLKDTALPWEYSNPVEVLEKEYDNMDLQLIYEKNKYNYEVAREIKSLIKDKLNINLTLIALEGLEIEEKLEKGNYDLALIDIIKEYDNSLSFYEKLSSYNAFNTFNYKNSNYDDIIIKVKKAADEAKYKEFLREGEKILIKDMPIIPLFSEKNLIYTKNNIYNIFLDYEGNILFNNISFNNM